MGHRPKHKNMMYCHIQQPLLDGAWLPGPLHTVSDHTQKTVQGHTWETL